jgi:hypothetical protein
LFDAGWQRSLQAAFLISEKVSQQGNLTWEPNHYRLRIDNDIHGLRRAGLQRLWGIGCQLIGKLMLNVLPCLSLLSTATSPP